MGLANHRKELRAEIGYYRRAFPRGPAVAVVTAALDRLRGGPLARCRPWCGRSFATSLSRALVMEQALGMSPGACARRWSSWSAGSTQLEGDPLPLEISAARWPAAAHRGRSPPRVCPGSQSGVNQDIDPSLGPTGWQVTH